MPDESPSTTPRAPATRIRWLPLALAAPVALFASDVRPTERASAHASAAFEAVYAHSGVPGLAGAIAIDEEIVWEAYRGLRDVDAGAPVTEETRFRIGSVSKAVTAVALARLWQAGGIDLDTDVRGYVEDFPDKGAAITPRMLAGHLGGIRSYQDADFADGRHIDRRHFPTTADALAIFADDPLVAPPGARYQYSVFGYTLLSAAMEGAAGRDFLTLLDDLVLDPLRLRHTGADSAGVPGRAVAYERSSDGGATIAEPLDFSYKWAGGGLHASVRDLVRLGAALVRPEFLTPAALALLTTPQTTNDGHTTAVGLGWRVGIDSRDRRFIHHAGTISGGRAVVLVYPDHRLAVALASNQALAPLMVEATAQVLAEPFLLEIEETHYDRVRPVARYAYRWTAHETEHAGALVYGADPADDGIDVHPALGAWSAGLGSPLPDGPAPILPGLLSDDRIFLPVVTAAGAFAIDARIDARDGLSGDAVGQFVRVAGPFRAERLAPR